jgi:hypothetical protein
MPNARNPYRSTFTSNPYLQSVFEGIDLLVADTQRQNMVAQQQEESNAQFERQKNVANISRKVGLLTGIMESKDTFAPETKQEAGKSLFSLVQDPNTDISKIDLKPYQKPEEPAKRTRQLTEYALDKRWGFDKFKGQELPVEEADFIEQEARLRRKEYYDTIAGKGPGAGSGKEKPTPRRKLLDEYRKEALNILHQGFTEEGYAGKVGLTPETISQFLGVIDDLRRKDDAGQWTEAEDAILKTLKPLEVAGIQGQGTIDALRGAILDAAEKARKLREE